MLKFDLNKFKKMEDNNSKKEQNEQLEEMNYPAAEDIFNKEKHISVDGNGNPIESGEKDDSMSMNLDVPGSDLDNQQEKIGSEDEENNYYSQSDNNDNHEERNDDLIS